MVAKRFVVCPDCKREFSKSADACPRCGWKPKKSRKSFSCCGVIAALLVVGFAGVVVIAIVSPGHPQGGDDRPVSSPTPVVAATPSLQAGDEAIVAMPKGHGVWIADDDSWDAMLDAQNARDIEELQILARRGAVDYELNGAAVKILKTGVSSMRVRVRKGNTPGFEGWVQREFVALPPS